MTRRRRVVGAEQPYHGLDRFLNIAMCNAGVLNAGWSPSVNQIPQHTRLNLDRDAPVTVGVAVGCEVVAGKHMLIGWSAKDQRGPLDSHIFGGLSFIYVPSSNHLVVPLELTM